jgi:hypothetical protein
MANHIKLLSVSEMLGYNFSIPSYQRGYRWTKQQVEDLLNDIYGFAIKKVKSDNEFYCLQPIVVKQQDGGVWEIVDGQQRLTTIRILLSYLVQKHLRGATLQEEYKKDLFTLTYETRPDSETFLDHIGEQQSGGDIDYYHMACAYQIISKWFDAQAIPRDAREAVISSLVNDPQNQKTYGTVQVIWYEIDAGANPIDTFIRINLGKIPLTSAELIKALFLQERNFETATDLGKLRQLEVAGEWDRIENSLQNDDFWWFLNKDKNLVSSRIEFIFDLMRQVAIKKDSGLADKIGADKFATFRYFSIRFEKTLTFEQLKQEWDDVKNFYMTFEQWFSDPEWYHYIGFLIYCGDDILSIYELSQQKPTKQKITEGLKDRIAETLSKVRWNEEPDIPYLDLNYPKDDSLIKRVLLLFNLAPIIDQSKNGTLIYKFPFKTFKRGYWDTEHIDAYNTLKMKDRKDQVAWLEYARLELAWLLQGDPLLEQVDDFIQRPGSPYNFDYLLEKITEKSGERIDGEESEELKKNIGNLTLLNAHVNRSYGNALFPTKRRKILEADAKGDFMPVNTRNVFLKYYDRQGTTRTKWTAADMEEYRNTIARALADFLPKPKRQPTTYEQV